MKNERIEIPITIQTVYKYSHDDKNEFSREQIEHAQLYLTSVFNFIKHAAMNLESEFAHDESEIVRGFCYDLTNFCEIGNALCSTIWKNVSGMQFGITETIAEKISFLINSDDVPSQISESLQDALTEILNASSQDETSKVEKSAEYIAKVLRDYQTND